jgi:acyl-CoA thioester hydrolase
VTERAKPPSHGDYPWHVPITTRWMDNDVYGHVNNVVYYAFFDTVINRYLIEVGGLDIHEGTVIGLAVETSCTFAGSVRFPEAVIAGLRVAHLGKSSVRYEVGIFVDGDDAARAFGAFTHVFVDRKTRRPVPIEGVLRDALDRVAVRATP